MHWSTPMGGRSSFTPTLPTFRTETGPGHCCGPRVSAGLLCNSPMPMRSTKGLASRQQARSGSRSSESRRARSASPSTRGAGWSSASSPDQGRRGDHRLSRSLPLRRFRYSTATKAGTLINRFEIDSNWQDQKKALQQEWSRSSDHYTIVFMVLWFFYRDSAVPSDQHSDSMSDADHSKFVVESYKQSRAEIEFCMTQVEEANKQYLTITAGLIAASLTGSGLHLNKLSALCCLTPVFAVAFVLRKAFYFKLLERNVSFIRANLRGLYR